MVPHVERLIESRHAFEIDGAIKEPGPIKAAAEHRPVQPVLAVG